MATVIEHRGSSPFYNSQLEIKPANQIKSDKNLSSSVKIEQIEKKIEIEIETEIELNRNWERDWIENWSKMGNKIEIESNWIELNLRNNLK